MSELPRTLRTWCVFLKFSFLRGIAIHGYMYLRGRRYPDSFSWLWIAPFQKGLPHQIRNQP